MEIIAMANSPKKRATRREVADRIRVLLKTWPIKPDGVGWMSYKPPVIRVTSPRSAQVTNSVHVNGSEIFFRGQVHGGKAPTQADVFEGMALYLCEWLTPMAALVVLLRGTRGETDAPAGFIKETGVRATSQEFMDADVVAASLIDKAATLSNVGISIAERTALLRQDKGTAAHEFLQRLAFLALGDSATEEI